MPRLIIITLFSMLLIAVQASEERRPSFSHIDESLQIDVSGMNGREKIYICDFFSCLNRRLNEFFPENRKSSSRTFLQTRILFTKDAGTGEVLILPTAKYVNIYLPPSFLETPGHDRQTMNKLIAAMILAKGGRVPSRKVAAVPYWLSSGITENVLSRMGGPIVYSFRIYPDLHNLPCNESSLKLSGLLFMPPESYDPEGGSLFREASEILVKELSRLKYQGENPFLEMAILYSQADVSDNMTAFNLSFREQILAEELKNPDKRNPGMTDQEKAESWFSSKLSKYALNYFLPASPEMSEKTFKSLREVRISGEKTCDITELPAGLAKIKDTKRKDAVFLELKNSTLLSANFIAPELRQPLNTLRTAIFRLSSGEISPKEFSESTKAACSEFAVKLETLKKIELWMLSLEAEHGLDPEIKRCSGIMRKLENIERNTRPDLNRFLDKTEKKFGK